MLPNGSSWEENLSLNLGLDHSSSTPTPPQSPGSHIYVGLGYETSFSHVDIVDPNAVLDESHLILDPAGLNFYSHRSHTSEDNIKRECWSPLADCLPGSSCKNEIFDESLSEILTHNTKTEIRNDCMWTSGSENFKASKSPISKTVPTKVCEARSRLDSLPSEYSKMIDPVNSLMVSINSDDPASRNFMLNTPADTSDTDTYTDLEDTCTVAENIQIEHNYHLSNNRISSDFSAFKKSNNQQVTKRQWISSTDCSDEEITIDEDSEESDSDNESLRNYSQIANCSPLRLKNSKENVIINTNFNGTDLQLFRKAFTPRKVGRPSKNLKRMQNSFTNNRRLSYRSAQMDPEKRKAHNDMERLRRGHLKSDFDNIRNLVPSVVSRVRAPKVLILNSATSFVFELNKKKRDVEKENQSLLEAVKAAKQKLEKLERDEGETGWEFG